MPFRLAIVVSSNPSNFVNAHCYERVSGVKNAHLIKLIGLLLKTKYTEPKLLILVSFFSGEVISYTDTSYCINIIIVGSMYATLYKLYIYSQRWELMEVVLSESRILEKQKSEVWTKFYGGGSTLGHPGATVYQTFKKAQ